MWRSRLRVVRRQAARRCIPTNLGMPSPHQHQKCECSSGTGKLKVNPNIGNTSPFGTVERCTGTYPLTYRTSLIPASREERYLSK